MTTLDILLKLGLSLGLGLLVGLQRERKGEELAGIRTFALITLLGTLSALLADQNAPWILPAATLALAILMAIGAYLKGHAPNPEIGLTTEIAALLMFALGAYLLHGDSAVSLVLGGSIALLLHLKPLLHAFVVRMGDRDVAAIMQFVLIALVILPILPNQNFGPYDFFNPFQTWLVVVLVVAVSLAGYVLYKLVPPSVSSLLGGIVGGLVSSTATTVAYARRSREDSEAAPLAAQAIMIATTVSVLRVMTLIGLIIGPVAAYPLLLPLGALAITMIILSAFTFIRRPTASVAAPQQSNPTELPSALFFAAIYSLVKLATAWSQTHFAAATLYLVGSISGLTDVDAITLSIAQSTQKNSLAATIALRTIVLAILANLLFKGATVFTLGHPRLQKQIAILFAAALVAGLAIFFLWKP